MKAGFPDMPVVPNLILSGIMESVSVFLGRVLDYEFIENAYQEMLENLTIVKHSKDGPAGLYLDRDQAIRMMNAMGPTVILGAYFLKLKRQVEDGEAKH